MLRDTKRGASLLFSCRYANELRYALVYAVFVTQIEMRTFFIPHAVRVPREIKLADSTKGSFDTQLRERLEKSAIELAIGIRDGKKRKRTGYCYSSLHDRFTSFQRFYINATETLNSRCKLYRRFYFQHRKRIIEKVTKRLTTTR